mmetsp:Transcript_8735/g.13050  ORF Transcript_8735/g.13050 Transcript_8735/m.13050 type:complete len:119 (+) Transcript_8735:158-514(+)
MTKSREAKMNATLDYTMNEAFVPKVIITDANDNPRILIADPRVETNDECWEITVARYFARKIRVAMNIITWAKERLYLVRSVKMICFGNRLERVTNTLGGLDTSPNTKPMSIKVPSIP